MTSCTLVSTPLSSLCRFGSSPDSAPECERGSSGSTFSGSRVSFASGLPIRVYGRFGSSKPSDTTWNSFWNPGQKSHCLSGWCGTRHFSWIQFMEHPTQAFTPSCCGSEVAVAPSQRSYIWRTILFEINQWLGFSFSIGCIALWLSFSPFRVTCWLFCVRFCGRFCLPPFLICLLFGRVWRVPKQYALANSNSRI